MPLRVSNAPEECAREERGMKDSPGMAKASRCAGSSASFLRLASSISSRVKWHPAGPPPHRMQGESKRARVESPGRVPCPPQRHLTRAMALRSDCQWGEACPRCGASPKWDFAPAWPFRLGFGCTNVLRNPFLGALSACLNPSSGHAACAGSGGHTPPLRLRPRVASLSRNPTSPWRRRCMQLPPHKRRELRITRPPPKRRKDRIEKKPKIKSSNFRILKIIQFVKSFITLDNKQFYHHLSLNEPHFL